MTAYDRNPPLWVILTCCLAPPLLGAVFLLAFMGSGRGPALAGPSRALSLDRLAREFRVNPFAAKPAYDGVSMTFKVTVGGSPAEIPVEECITITDQPETPLVLCFPAADQLQRFRDLKAGDTVTVTGIVHTGPVMIAPSIPAGTTGNIEDLHSMIQAAANRPPVPRPPPGGFSLKRARLVRP